jgi:Bacterial Ig-like domain (group 2)
VEYQRECGGCYRDPELGWKRGEFRALQFPGSSGTARHGKSGCEGIDRRSESGRRSECDTGERAGRELVFRGADAVHSPLNLSVNVGIFNVVKVTCYYGTIWCAGYTGLAISPSPITLPVGGSLQVNALGLYNDGTQPGVNSYTSWSCRNSSVASITPGGQVTGVAPGSATIIASASCQHTGNTAATTVMRDASAEPDVPGTDTRLRKSQCLGSRRGFYGPVQHRYRASGAQCSRHGTRGNSRSSTTNWLYSVFVWASLEITYYDSQERYQSMGKVT